MISEYTESDASKIVYVINDASLRYKNIIPDNCWHEPYMSEQELFDEFNEGVNIHQKIKDDPEMLAMVDTAIETCSSLNLSTPKPPKRPKSRPNKKRTKTTRLPKPPKVKSRL